MISALYSGAIIHRRLRPRPHRLRYRAFWLLLDLDEIGSITDRLWLLSRNRWNLAAFHDADHGDGSAVPLKQQAQTLLRDAGVTADGRIQLFCMPRVLGYGFNPISMYLCHDRGGELAATIYQVHNTFGERHSYVLASNPDAGGVISQHCAKTFHVSPFLPMTMTYDFRLVTKRDRLSLAIEGGDRDGPLIVAALSGNRRGLTDRALAWALLTHPLMTLKVIAGIHWHAARMIAKRFAWYTWRPKEPGGAASKP